MDKERFTERILETENLTDELEDSDANWLLDWGIGQLDRALQDAGDEETAGNRVNALMAVMRKINRIVGSYADKSQGSLAEDLAALHELFVAVFGPVKAPPAQPAASAQQESPPSTDESQPPEPQRKCWIFSLLARIKPPEDSQPTKATPEPEELQPAEPELSEASSAVPASDRLETQPSAQAGFDAAAAHLAQLSPRQALEFLAQNFFPLPN